VLDIFSTLPEIGLLRLLRKRCHGALQENGCGEPLFPYGPVLIVKGRIFCTHGSRS
jgi:hypothetical protein